MQIVQADHDALQAELDALESDLRRGPRAVEQDFGLDPAVAGLVWEEGVLTAVYLVAEVIRDAVSVDDAIQRASFAVLDDLVLPLRVGEAESEGARESAREEGAARVDAIIRVCLERGVAGARSSGI